MLCVVSREERALPRRMLTQREQAGRNISSQVPHGGQMW